MSVCTPTQTIITIVGAIFASSGFWLFLQRWLDKRDNKTKLLLGLTHDRIVELGTYYLERGDWITKSEYENLHDYLYVPYEKEGGNGTGKRVMKDVDTKLRLVWEP